MLIAVLVPLIQIALSCGSCTLVLFVESNICLGLYHLGLEQGIRPEEYDTPLKDILLIYNDFLCKHIHMYIGVQFHSSRVCCAPIVKNMYIVVQDCDDTQLFV